MVVAKWILTMKNHLRKHIKRLIYLCIPIKNKRNYIVDLA